MRLTLRKYHPSSGACEGVVRSIRLDSRLGGMTGAPFIFDVAIDGVQSISSVTVKLSRAEGANVLRAGQSGLCDSGVVAVAVLDEITPDVVFSQYFCGIGSSVVVPMRNGYLSKYIHMAAAYGVSNETISTLAFEFQCLITQG